jgi:hypothetical protein
MDNIAVGKFVNLILEDIHGCLINHQCSSMNESTIDMPTHSTDSTVFARNLLTSLQPYLARYEHCQCIDDYSQLHYRDIREFIIQKSDGTGITWFCDMGMTYD